MPLNPYSVSISIFASDGITGFPGVSVTLKNTTKNEKHTKISNASGQVAFELSTEFNFGYSNGDSLQVQARFGSFYQITTGTVDTGTGYSDFSLTLAAMEQYNIKLIDFLVLKEELVKFLRRNLTDPNSRMSSRTDMFTATSNQLKFVLTDTTAKVIKKVMVNNSVLTEYTQYYTEYQDKNTLNYPTVYLLTPATKNDIVEIEYTYGSSDWIYPDYPRVDITIDSYPRVMIDFLTMTTREMSLGAADNISELIVTNIIWSKKPNELYDLISQVRQLFMENKKNFFFFPIIYPMRISPVIKSPDRAESIIQMSQDFSIPLKVEAIA